ncbi:tRNA pseudouridine(55) synthase TruB [Candidatus Saccharibacteria bacterium]|nr:tRNA pseudouridine(55) synthase TruB [Candidatus Saccharibacteria bacterium]
MNGYLLIDKPKGWTSFDIVARIRAVLKRAGVNRPKVGHSGTLDPLATGLLVILVGTYTKRAAELTKLDKTYEVTMKLGQTSSTGDEEGQKTVLLSKRPSQTAVEAAIKLFRGEIEQTPPIYSAVQIDGQRAYKLARAGKEVKIQPRKVKIHSIKLTDYNYPEIQFVTNVSSGTYIRSLVEDIGKKLHTGAYTSELCRTQIGLFKLNEAVKIESLASDHIYATLKTLA